MVLVEFMWESAVDIMTAKSPDIIIPLMPKGNQSI